MKIKGGETLEIRGKKGKNVVKAYKRKSET